MDFQVGLIIGVFVTLVVDFVLNKFIRAQTKQEFNRAWAEIIIECQRLDAAIHKAELKFAARLVAPVKTKLAEIVSITPKEPA